MIFKKKWIVTGLAFVLALGLTACNNQKVENNGQAKNGKEVAAKDELAPEYTYVANYLSFPEEFQNGEFVFSGNNVYASCYDYDTTSLKSTYVIKKATIEGNGFGTPQAIYAAAGDNYLQSITADKDGNVYFILVERPVSPDDNATEQEWNDYYESMEQNSVYNLVKLDADGNEVFKVDFTDRTKDGEYFYANSMIVDGQGRIYMSLNDSGVLLFDANGSCTGKAQLSVQGWIDGIGLAKDGKVYACYYNYSGESASGMIAEIDFDNKQFGKSYKNFPIGNGNSKLFPGVEGDIICSDSNSVSSYSFEKEESTKILTWLDCDIEGNKIRNVYCGEDGAIYVVVQDWENGTCDFAALSKVKTEEIVKRETITVGVIYQDSTISSQIVKFNKSNDKYRVTMKAYLDENDWSEKSYQDAITNLTNDLIAGTGPDILDLSAMDVRNLAKKGVLEDLMPYLTKSTVLDKNDIFPEILEAGSVDGKLCYISSGFTLETLAGKTSVVGTKRGWTVEDMIALQRKYPNADILDYADQSTIMQIMLILNKGEFIDYDKNECHFDTQEFKDVLTFAKTFPKEYDYEQEKRLAPFRLKDNTLLLSDVSVYDFAEMQSALAYFDGEPVTFIGYPTYDGGNGCLLNMKDKYGISSKSANKEAAWAFLEAMVASAAEDSSNYFYGFSSMKSIYNKQKEDALAVNYVLDENGDPVLDENGEPIVEDMNGRGYTMMGDNGEEWTFNYKPITEEEVNLVEDLLKGAKVIDLSTDNEMNNIINEEAQAFFSGSKSLDEVVNVIQNRVNLYLKENN